MADGRSHRFRTEEDDARQKTIEALGVQFLRFKGASVRSDARPAVRVIERWIEEQEAGERLS